MKSFRRNFTALSLCFLFATALFSFQKEFREYPGMEYTDFKLPSDYKEPAEFVFARMMYPNAPGRLGGFGRFGDWRQGSTNWTNDYPRADRHLLTAFRRLTRLDARSVEQPVNLEDGDDVYNWPFLYAARAGSMWLTDEMVVKLRDYLDRGGFLILDDMWGDAEYEVCLQNVQRIFPAWRLRKWMTRTRSSMPFTTLTSAIRFQASGRLVPECLIYTAALSPIGKASGTTRQAE